MDQLWSPRDKEKANGSLDVASNHDKTPRPCPTCPVTAPARFFRPKQLPLVPGVLSETTFDSDKILEAEFEIIHRRCVSAINDILDEARSRISTRLHNVAGTTVVANPEPFAIGIDDPLCPKTFSRFSDFDDFNPQALCELVGETDIRFNTNYLGDPESELFIETQQDQQWETSASRSYSPKVPYGPFQDASTTGASKSAASPKGQNGINGQRNEDAVVSSTCPGGDIAPARKRNSEEIRKISKQKELEAQEKASRKMATVYSDGEPDIFSFCKIVEAARTFSISFEGGQRATIQRLLASTKWDLFIASVIMTNAMYMGYQIDWAATNVNKPTPIEQYIIGYFYTTIFSLELAFRMIDERCHFWSFKNKMTHWNYLDCFIVASSLVEIYFDYQLLASQNEDGSASAGLDAGQIRIVRIIRISRLMKIFRIARLVHFIRALRTLVFSILCTLKSVFWALLLMLLIIYVFAMILTQAVGGFKETHGCTQAPDLCYHWGHLSVSMLSLFKAIAGGISWHEILVPLQSNLDPTWVMVFLFYVIFLYFAVLNVITGVFCESAIQSAKADQEMVIAEAVQSKRKYKEKLARLFREIDEDGSNEITLDELEQYMTSEMSGAFFEYLELEVNNASDVIKLIDVDGSGELTLDEFIDGVCRLRGTAKALDIAAVLYDSKAFQTWVFKAVEDISNVLSHYFHVDLTGQARPPADCPVEFVGNI